MDRPIWRQAAAQCAWGTGGTINLSLSTTSGQETERVYSYNPGARTGRVMQEHVVMDVPFAVQFSGKCVYPRQFEVRLWPGALRQLLHHIGA